MKVKQPALWFTANAVFEAKVAKLLKDEFGNLHQLTFEEMHEKTGVGRISILYSKELMTWECIGKLLSSSINSTYCRYL